MDIIEALERVEKIVLRKPEWYQRAVAAVLGDFAAMVEKCDAPAEGPPDSDPRVPIICMVGVLVKPGGVRIMLDFVFAEGSPVKVLLPLPEAIELSMGISQVGMRLTQPPGDAN